jgi:arsenate reductase (thioredoxin)
MPTADTWMRFSRLIVAVERPGNPAAGRSERRASVGSEVELPPVLRRITERLAYRFSSTFSKETVERYVADSYRLLSERAKVSKHLSSLTTRFVEDRLNALAAASGRDLRGTPEVLFVCVQNAGRSQMAAALLRQMVGDRVHIRTAGSRPSGQIDSMVVEVLDEIGVPVVAEFPKPLTDEVVQAADFVITMGCGDACPIYPGRRYMDWPVADPIGQPLDDVRHIRDDIAARLKTLCQEMDITPA